MNLMLGFKYLLAASGVIYIGVYVPLEVNYEGGNQIFLRITQRINVTSC
jgi:hypothetical protein